MNVVEKPIISVVIILNGLYINTMWVLGGIRLAEDIDQ
jgi:hypothetical protein